MTLVIPSVYSVIPSAARTLLATESPLEGDPSLTLGMTKSFGTTVT